MRKIFIWIAITLVAVLLLNIVLCLGVGWRLGIFQGQPCLYVNDGGDVLQRCVDGAWRWFSDPEIRWTDGGLHQITGAEYYED